jgi:hypothetical protein
VSTHVVRCVDVRPPPLRGLVTLNLRRRLIYTTGAEIRQTYAKPRLIHLIPPPNLYKYTRHMLKAPSTHISGCYIVICFPHLRISSFEHLQSTLLICLTFCFQRLKYASRKVYRDRHGRRCAMSREGIAMELLN